MGCCENENHESDELFYQVDRGIRISAYGVITLLAIAQILSETKHTSRCHRLIHRLLPIGAIAELLLSIDAVSCNQHVPGFHKSATPLRCTYACVLCFEAPSISSLGHRTQGNPLRHRSVHNLGKPAISRFGVSLFC